MNQGLNSKLLSLIDISWMQDGCEVLLR